MTQVLQLLAFVAAIVGLICFGVHRDKKEHSKPENGQERFDTQQEPGDVPAINRSAAISKLR